MRWNSESHGTWKARVKQWRRWFAWTPVWLAHTEQMLWLESCERRLIAEYNGEGLLWEYRAARSEDK